MCDFVCPIQKGNKSEELGGSWAGEKEHVVSGKKEKGVKRKDSFLKLCVHSLFKKDDV